MWGDDYKPIRSCFSCESGKMSLTKRVAHCERTIDAHWVCQECSFTQITRMAAGAEEPRAN